MKKLIRILLIIAIVLALALIAFAVSNKYQAYKVNQRLQTLSQQSRDKAAQDKADQALTDIKNVDTTRITALKAECTKGIAAYNLLTVTNQKKVTAPNCDVAGQ